MKKKTLDEPATKAQRRDVKKRPRMPMHGRGLRAPSTHEGKKITSR